VLKVIIKRIAIAIPVVIGVSAIVFFVMRVLPGNPVQVITAGAPTTPGERHDLMVEFGLNHSVLDQYFLYVWHALHGSFGNSYSTRLPVMTEIKSQVMATVELAAGAMILVTFFGLALGVLAARFHDTWVDSVIRVLSLFGTSMPTIWTGPLLILLFSFTFPLFPATGSGSLSELVLPAVALSILASGYIVRLVRNSMLEVMSMEFVLALYAKGVRERTIWIRHVLRNALVPTVTVLGVQLGSLLSGAVIAEIVFGRQGLGSLLVSSVEGKDYPMVQAIVLLVATGYVVVNIIVDISYAFLDPRVRTAMAN
jgi:ABC-type dipeptide/oligopeptide/nickel transport system permease component